MKKETIKTEEKSVLSLYIGDIFKGANNRWYLVIDKGKTRIHHHLTIKTKDINERYDNGQWELAENLIERGLTRLVLKLNKGN